MNRDLRNPSDHDCTRVSARAARRCNNHSGRPNTAMDCAEGRTQIADRRCAYRIAAVRPRKHFPELQRDRSFQDTAAAGHDELLPRSTATPVRPRQGSVIHTEVWFAARGGLEWKLVAVGNGRVTAGSPRGRPV